MKRSQSSTSIAEIEREKMKELSYVRGLRHIRLPTKREVVYDGEKKKEMYAVFEVPDPLHLNNGYYIYKLEDSSAQVLGEPIDIVKFKDHHPVSMSIFSLGSKIYFVGGFWYNSGSPWANYSRKAFMFDVASNQGIRIQSMKYPKPNPLVFGPDDDSKFYVFSASVTINSKVVGASFEILDTGSNTWESLHLHSSFTRVKSSAFCGSNILILTTDGTLLVFSTKSKMWREIPHSEGPNFLPFSTAIYVGASKTFGHILLGFRSIYGNPALYSPKAGNDDVEGIGPFMISGNVEGFRRNVTPLPYTIENGGGFGTGCVLGIHYFDRDSFCLVRTPELRSRCVVRKLVIDIFDISYSGLDDTEVEVKAKVQNVVQYQYLCKIPMAPRHFLAVG